MSTPGGHESGGADDADGGVVQSVLGLGEALGGALLQAQILQLGTILHRLADQIVDPVRQGLRASAPRPGRSPIRSGSPMAVGEVRLGGLHVVLRLDQQQFGIRQVDVGEADVQRAISTCSRPSAVTWSDTVWRAATVWSATFSTACARSTPK